MKNITAISSRGDTRGTLLKPHRYTNGHYLAAKGGNAIDCRKRVFDEAELPIWVSRGYSIRMSGKGVKPSLICPKSLRIE